MPAEATLWLLLAVYAVGTLWVLGLLYVTVMKFAGIMRIERPRWLFGSVHRAMGVVLASAAALILFDLAVQQTWALE